MKIVDGKMITEQNEIKYHKDIDLEQAERLFNEAFREYVDTIITKSQIWRKEENGRVVEIPKFL